MAATSSQSGPSPAAHDQVQTHPQEISSLPVSRQGRGYRLKVDGGVAWVYVAYNQGAELQAADRQGA